jgi:hypothetical protein
VTGSRANGLALGDLPRVERVELDSPGDVGDAGLAGLAGGKSPAFLDFLGLEALVGLDAEDGDLARARAWVLDLLDAATNPFYAGKLAAALAGLDTRAGDRARARGRVLDLLDAPAHRCDARLLARALEGLSSAAVDLSSWASEGGHRRRVRASGPAVRQAGGHPEGGARMGSNPCQRPVCGPRWWPVKSPHPSG